MYLCLDPCVMQTFVTSDVIGSFNRSVPFPWQMGGQLVPVWSSATDNNRAESPEHQGAMHRIGGRQVRRGG